MNNPSASGVWETVLVTLKRHVSRANYDTWLQDTVGLALQDGCLTVAAPTPLAMEWLQNRMASLVRKTLAELMGQPTDVRFALKDSAPQSPRPTRGNPSTFNPRHTFASFVVGSNNRLAHAAALSVSERPGDSYNPLFIYGGVGLGKTHLLDAVGHHSSQRHMKALYVSCEQFTNEFINAIRDQRNEEFRRKFRGADLLLVDDIQFIAGKEQTQEEFFHTFNDLHSSGRQLVISSDRHPKSMPLLEDRLRSRFEWGLIADIQPPDFETRVAILRSKADMLGTSLPSEVLEHVALKVQSNIRELEGCLNRLVAHSKLNRSLLTLETASSILQEYLKGSGRRTPTPQAILEVIAKYYSLQESDISGKKRDRDIALPRQIAMYLLREETKISLDQIGGVLGGRDHSTVLHGWNKISAAVNSNLPLRREIMEIKEILFSRRPA